MDLFDDEMFEDDPPRPARPPREPPRRRGPSGETARRVLVAIPWIERPGSHSCNSMSDLMAPRRAARMPTGSAVSGVSGMVAAIATMRSRT